MPTLKIQLREKNDVLIGDVFTMVSDYVPRVGDILEMSEQLRGEPMTTFTVSSVVLVATEGRFVPHIVARMAAVDQRDRFDNVVHVPAQ